MIQNGIEMTGMPSWSNEYKENDIWSVVAFLKQLPNISAQQYQEMTRASSHGGIDFFVGLGLPKIPSWHAACPK